MARKVIAALGGDVRGKSIALLGLTFKPNTDDMRDSPALAIVQVLEDAGATVRAYDPEGMETARALMPNLVYTDSAYAAAEGACAVVIATEWDAFRALDLKRLNRTMAQPVVVDLRNIYCPKAVEAAGFTYCSVGRPSHAKPVFANLAAPAEATVD